MANTTNIDLVKPAGTDHALVAVINANSDKIDAEAGNVRSNFALVQNTNTATQAISKDQLVVWKGVLKKATSNIANGATLSNSNLTDTNVSTELASLSDQIGNLFTTTYLQDANASVPTTGYIHTFQNVTLTGYSIVGFCVDIFSKISDAASVSIVCNGSNVYVRIFSNLDYDITGLNYRIKVLWMKN